MREKENKRISPQQHCSLFLRLPFFLVFPSTCRNESSFIVTSLFRPLHLYPSIMMNEGRTDRERRNIFHSFSSRGYEESFSMVTLIPCALSLCFPPWALMKCWPHLRTSLSFTYYLPFFPLFPSMTRREMTAGSSSIGLHRIDK